MYQNIKMTSKIAIKFVLAAIFDFHFCAPHSALTPEVDIKTEGKYGQSSVYYCA